MLSNARASLLARFAPPLEPPLPSSSSNGAAPPLPRVSVRSALPWLAGATAAASLALYAASVARSMGWQPWQRQVEPLPPAMAEAAAAIGLPEYAVRPHYSAELDLQLSQRRTRQPAAAAAAPEQQQQQQAVAAISRQAATRLVQQWLVSAACFAGCHYRRVALHRGVPAAATARRLAPARGGRSASSDCIPMTADAPVVILCVYSPLPDKQNIKTEAMGPYHSVDRLPEVRVAAQWLEV